MLRFFSLIILALVVSCDQVDSDTITVKRTYAVNEAELRNKCGESLIVEPLGCAIKHGSRCEIVAYKPRGFDDHRRVETLGHELLHCFDGPTHY